MEHGTKKSWRDSQWTVCFCCFMLIFTGLGFCSSPRSFFMDVVPDALGVGRSQFALNDTARYIVTATVSLYFGRLVTWLRPKKMIAIGSCLMVISQLIYATADNVVMFCMGGALLGGGLSLLGNSMASYIIKRRCPKNTGTILGFVMAANGLGGAIAVQMVSHFIEQSPTGYKNAYLAVACILAAVGLMVTLIYKEDDSIPAAPPASKKARGQNWSGMSYAHGKKQGYFYLICLLIFLTGFVLSGVNGIAKAHWRDMGIQNVADIWSLHSLALMGGKFISGFVYDRKGLRFTLALGHLAAITVMVALALSGNTPFGIAMAWVYSIGSAAALPLETICVSLVAGDLFGNKEFSRFLGVLTALCSLGFATGSPVINLVYDLVGSYLPAILVSAGIMVFVLVTFQLSITAARKDRDAILAQEK